MSRTYNEQFFSSLEYIQKFKDTLAKKELLNNIKNKYQLTEEQAKEMVDNYE
tara:strand:- start:526 stop:681 length:156 start_codon:yes stop_codon:yes gene_type:complete